MIITFIDVPTNKFGEALRAQVEERLTFFEVSFAVGRSEMETDVC
jgi:nucleolar protein 56